MYIDRKKNRIKMSYEKVECRSINFFKDLSYHICNQSSPMRISNKDKTRLM